VSANSGSGSNKGDDKDSKMKALDEKNDKEEDRLKKEREGYGDGFKDFEATYKARTKKERGSGHIDDKEDSTRINNISSRDDDLVGTDGRKSYDDISKEIMGMLGKLKTKINENIQ